MERKRTPRELGVRREVRRRKAMQLLRCRLVWKQGGKSKDMLVKRVGGKRSKRTADSKRRKEHLELWVP